MQIPQLANWGICTAFFFDAAETQACLHSSTAGQNGQRPLQQPLSVTGEEGRERADNRNAGIADARVQHIDVMVRTRPPGGEE